MSPGEIKETVYCIIYHFKFINILTVIFVSLFGCSSFRYYSTIKIYEAEKSVPDVF